jgi:hypothetical protein
MLLNVQKAFQGNTAIYHASGHIETSPINHSPTIPKSSFTTEQSGYCNHNNKWFGIPQKPETSRILSKKISKHTRYT